MALLAVLVLNGCGGDGGDEETSSTTSSTTIESTTSTSVISTTAGGGGTTSTRITLATTTLPPAAGTPVDLSLVPERDQLSASVGKATINGKDYTSALIVEPYGNRTSRLEIDAGRRRTRFLGDMGIPDNQRSSTAYKVDISFDQAAPALSTEVRFGETKRIDLDVTGVLRIKIALTPLTSPGSPCCGVIGIGEPLLR